MIRSVLRIRPRNLSFKARLTLTMTLLVFVTLTGVTFVTVQVVQSSLAEQIGETFETSAASLGEVIGTSLLGRVSELEVLTLTDVIKNPVEERNASYSGNMTDIEAEILELDAQWRVASADDALIHNVISDDPTENGVTALLADFVETFPNHDRVFVTDRYGALLAATNRQSDYYQADEGWWQAAWNDGEGAVYISDPRFYSDVGVSALTIAVPIRAAPHGEVIGILRARLVLNELDEIIFALTIGQTGHAVLFDDSGKVLIDPRMDVGVGSAELALELRQHLVNKMQHSMVAPSESAEPTLFGYVRVHVGGQDGGEVGSGDAPTAINDLNWSTVIRQETWEAFASAGAISQSVMLAGLLAVALATLAALFSARSIIRPLVRLGATVDQIGAGKLDTPLPPAGDDEVGRLTNSFAIMTTRLREMLQSEQTQREKLLGAIVDYTEHMARVADGDLVARLPLNANGQSDADPLVALGRHLNAMTASLQHTIAEQRDTAGNLAEASAQILASTSQQVSGANEQSATATQTAITMEEVSKTSQEAAKRAQEVVELAQRTVDVSRDGREIVQQTIDGMLDIKRLVEGIAQNIVLLSERTHQIGEIITTVDDIAAQSKMLALNASVEAARAGAQGRGFAAVAVEVRRLAGQSRQATLQVRAILTDIQKATSTAVMATEEGSRGVDRGVGLADQARAVIDQLTQVINESAQAATQMMVGGQQQALGLEQVSASMTNIRRTSMQNLAATRQTEESAQSLNDLAARLGKMVEQYRV